MLRHVRLAATTLIVTLTATAASAVGPCASRSDIIAALKNNFGEVEVGRGLSNRGHLVELFVSPEGSWTMLLSRPDGLSCLGDAGPVWDIVPANDRSHPVTLLAPSAAF